MAGTQSTPALPASEGQPSSIASYFESPHRHSLSLAPPTAQLPVKRLSYCSEPINHTRMMSQENCLEFVDVEYSHANVVGLPPNTRAEPALSHTIRSDILRHALPRPRNIPFMHGVASRVAKHQDKRNLSRPADKHARRRVAFHRVLNSLFSTDPGDIQPTRDSLLVSTSTNGRSRANSGSLNGSMPSLEFVSAGAFIFSGPSLKSRSRSFSASTSHCSGLTGDSSDLISLHCAQSDASMVNHMLVSC